MKSKYLIILLLFSLAAITFCNRKNSTQNFIQENEKKAIEKVMKSYKNAIENLTTEGTFELFTEDASVFEQGKVEGTYKDYIDHHLGPELGHFKSFTFSDYKINSTISMPYAYTTESYLYTIVLKGDDKSGKEEKTIESKGVATSVLKKINGEWKIIHSHSSFRKIKK